MFRYHPRDSVTAHGHLGNTHVSSCYSKLSTLTLTEYQLRQCNYPRHHPTIPDKAKIYNIANSYYHVKPGPFLRNCKRCFKIYNIDDDGRATNKEDCLYHPYRVAGKYPRFRCCQGHKDSYPCSRASEHVSDDIDPDNIDGFLTTKGNHRVTTKNFYALDCEMVLTKAGSELACISIVDSNCSTVYETMVLPDNPIIDYLTEHSDLTERDFRGVTTSLKDVHEKLFTLFGEETILVGHSLNNDLMKLKIFHDNIVDTSVAYPHFKGPEYRNSLRFLRDKYLQTSLASNSNVAKCRDDAQASMKLALLKCK